MALSPRTDTEYRRWLVVGTVLHRVLMPYLRNKIQQEMTPFYQNLLATYGLDKQTYSTHVKTFPLTTLKLNYESINNNATPGRGRHLFDYCVKDEVSLAKLFMKPFMAHFNAFDSSFDASAALAVLCYAPPFSSAAPSAELVRSEVRNEWAHYDYASWTEVKYDTCFDRMETLVKDMGFALAEKTELLAELHLWRKHGIEFCVGRPLNDTFLSVIRDEVVALSGTLTGRLEETNDNMNQIREMFEAILHELNKCKHEQQPTRQDLEKTSSKTLEVKTPAMQNIWETLLSRKVNVSTAHYRSVVFDAPDQIKWFTGRQKELESLERCLPFENSHHEFRMAAICGLGGCGKTTLAAQFAWKHKPQYEGSVFWFSMEDEEKFESCVNDLAIRLGLMKNSSDLTLKHILTFISQQEKRWLMVLDNVDQPLLSVKMRIVLKGKWKRETNGHILITTRREKKEICQCVDLEPNCCVEITPFSIEEAKEFLLSRCSGENASDQEDTLNELVDLLGCLPLALEQAGAHIRSLECPVKKYLEQFRLERLKLVREHEANSSSEYDSTNRLSVHTTWLLNFDHVRSSRYGEIATRFVQAAAFLDPDEIQERLINTEILFSDIVAENKTELPLTNNHIVEVLTKFSLFQRKSVGCMRVHRLVQHVIRGTMTPQEVEKAMYRTFQLLKKAAQSAGESATNNSLFSIIRNWLALKRHIEEQVRATPDDLSAEKLATLMNSGNREIVLEVARTLEGLTQTLENRRGLSALLDTDYDRCLGKLKPEYKRSARHTMESSLRSSSRLPSGSPSGSPPGSPSRSSPGSPSGSLSGAPFGSPQEWSLERALRPPTRITTRIARRIAMIFLCGTPRSRRGGNQ